MSKILSRTLVTAAIAATALTLAGCAPGSANTAAQTTSGTSSKSVNTNPATMGKLTLTVWDQETTPGISNSLNKLNKEFHKKYPNITVNRVTRSGTDLLTTLKLALASKNPPDVTQANEGFADMASYVKAGSLTNLGPYNQAYGWSKRIPSSQLALDSVQADGSKIGTGNLYGVSATGEDVGIFYNKAILKKIGIPVPTTIKQLESELPKVKAASVLPISYGDQNLSPSIHVWGVTVIPALGHKAASNLVFGGSGSWDVPAVTDSAAVLQQWAQDGYLTPGANGINSNSAATSFGKGASAFFLGGNWNQEAVTEGLGDNGAGYLLLPNTEGASLAAMGGLGEGWAIPTKASHKDASAAYIDFVTNAHSAEVYLQNNQLPAVPPADAKATKGTLSGDILTSWAALTKSNGLAPYLDWSTPTMYNTLSNNLQLLIAQKTTPADLAKALEADRNSFYSGNN